MKLIKSNMKKRSARHLHTATGIAIMIVALSLLAGCGLGKGGKDSVSDGDAASDSATGTLADLAARNAADSDAERFSQCSPSSCICVLKQVRAPRQQRYFSTSSAI